MTTLADISLRVVKEVADVLESTGTASSATSLTDSVKLTQQAGYWEDGTIWILSGTHAGKVGVVTGFVNKVLSFATFGSDVATPRYAVARKLFPWNELMKATNNALTFETVQVLNSNTTLLGTGTTEDFTLPAGVYNVREVWFRNTSVSPYRRTPSHHWDERNGHLIFDTGYAPRSNYTIEVNYDGPHSVLTAYSDIISNDINLDWLKWKSVEHLMTWAINNYGNNPQKNYAQFLQNARDMLQTLKPLRRTRAIIKTA